MRIIKITIATLLLSGIAFVGKAQNTEGVKIGNDVSPPHSSAMLEVESASKGVLVPRVNIEDLNTAAPVDGPEESLLVFNTNNSTGKGYYYWDISQSKWVALGNGNGTSLWSETVVGDDIYNNSDKVLIGADETASFYTIGGTLFQPRLQIRADEIPDISLNVKGRDSFCRLAQVGDGYRQFHYGGGHTIFLNAGNTVENKEVDAMFSIYGHTDWLEHDNLLFRVRGTGDAELYGTLSEYSDSTLKMNIQPIQSSLSKIVSLRGVTYNWKNINKGTALHMGVIAQEVESVFPELVNTNEAGIKSVMYGGLTAPLIEATKEQQVLIEQLQATIQQLEQRIATLENN